MAVLLSVLTNSAWADRRDVAVDQDQTGDVTVAVEDATNQSGAPSTGGEVICHYYLDPVTTGGAADDLVAVEGELVEGQAYWLLCIDIATDPPTSVASRYVIFDPGVPSLSPLALAQRAVATLTLAHPAPSINPPGGQLPGIETWWWIDPNQWQPASATATIPGLSATATATPMSVTWDPADGSPPTTCDGPGTPYDPTQPPAEQSTDCSHVYQDRGTYDASATITYAVTWTATDGTSGTLADAGRTTVFTVRVDERQAVG